MAIGTSTLRPSGEARRAQRGDEEDLLAGVGRRRDGVGREDGQGDDLRDPLVLLLVRRERTADEQSLQRPEHKAAPYRRPLHPRTPPFALAAGGGVKSAAYAHHRPRLRTHRLAPGDDRWRPTDTPSPSSTASRDAFRRLPERFTGRAVLGNVINQSVLEQAGIAEAGAVAAVTSGDNSNIVAARIARETYEIESVVARIKDPKRAEIYQRLGIPTVATVTWTTDQVMRRLFPDESTTDWTHPGGTLHLVERDLPVGWAGQKLDPLVGTGKPDDRFRLVAVTRAGDGKLSAPGLVGQEGDLLHLLVHDDANAELEQLLERRRGTRMKVVIAGAGAVGTFVASDLKAANHEVLLIERNPDLVAAPATGERRRPVRRRRLRGVGPRRGRHRRRRRDGGGDRRGSGQPRDLAAGQAGVRRAPRRRPHQRAPQQVALQRVVGRGRVRLDAPPPHRADRGGGVGRVARPPAGVRGRRGAAHRGDARRRLPRQRPDDHGPRRPPRRDDRSPIVRRGHVVVPRGDTLLQAGDEVLALTTPDSEDAVKRILIGET